MHAAVASIVLGIVAILCIFAISIPITIRMGLCIMSGIAGIALGILSIKLARSNMRLAVTGIVLSSIGLLVLITVIVGLFFAFH